MYESAKAKFDIRSMKSALIVLAEIDANAYQSESQKVSLAVDYLDAAQQAMENANYFQAYVNSSKSHQVLYSPEAEKLLIKSVGPLKLVAETESLILALPFLESLDNDLASLSSQPIPEWNVIEAKEFFAALTEANIQFDELKKQMHKRELREKAPELVPWLNLVEKQFASVHQARNSLLSSTLHEANDILLRQNKALSDKADRLLYRMHPSAASDLMARDFSIAQAELAPYELLITNLYLTMKRSGDSEVEQWYKNWKFSADQALIPDEYFDYYVKNVEIREKIFRETKGFYDPHMPKGPLLADMVNYSKTAPEFSELIASFKTDRLLMTKAK